MKHETEINYLKKRLAKFEEDLANFAMITIQAGIVEIVEEDGKKVYKINKVKLDG